MRERSVFALVLSVSLASGIFPLPSISTGTMAKQRPILVYFGKGKTSLEIRSAEFTEFRWLSVDHVAQEVLCHRIWQLSVVGLLSSGYNVFILYFSCHVFVSWIRC